MNTCEGGQAGWSAGPLGTWYNTSRVLRGVHDVTGCDVTGCDVTGCDVIGCILLSGRPHPLSDHEPHRDDITDRALGSGQSHHTEGEGREAVNHCVQMRGQSGEAANHCV